MNFLAPFFPSAYTSICAPKLFIIHYALFIKNIGQLNELPDVFIISLCIQLSPLRELPLRQGQSLPPLRFL